MPKCLELLDELYQMPITPLMLKKQPDIVTTIRKLRKYIGPQTEPSDPKVLQLAIEILSFVPYYKDVTEFERIFYVLLYLLFLRMQKNGEQTPKKFV